MTLNEAARTAVRAAIEKLNQVPTQAAYSWAVRDASDTLRAIPGVMTRTTTFNVVPKDDTLTKLLDDMENKGRIAPHGLSDEYGKRLRALLDDCATEPENPEVIMGSEVADLPVGSFVTACGPDGEMRNSASVRRVGPGEGFPAPWYRVLDRAPEKPIEVGDEVTGTRADALPVGTIVQWVDGYPWLRTSDGWRMGPGDAVHSVLPLADRTFRVLSIGGK